MFFHKITKQLILYLLMTNPGWKKYFLPSRSVVFALFETKADSSSYVRFDFKKCNKYYFCKPKIVLWPER